MVENKSNEIDDERGPLRRCVVCKAEVPRDLALRFVAGRPIKTKPDVAEGQGEAALPESAKADAGFAVWDPARKAPGRGFSVCAMSACLTKLRSDLPGVKAVGARVSGTLTLQMLPALERDVLEKLGLLWRQRKLLIGVEPIADALGAGDRFSGAVVANDASERSAKVLQEKLGNRAVTIPVGVAQLGAALGRDVVAAAAFRDDSVTSAMGLFGRVKLWSDLAARSASFEQGQGRAHG